MSNDPIVLLSDSELALIEMVVELAKEMRLERFLSDHPTEEVCAFTEGGSMLSITRESKHHSWMEECLWVTRYEYVVVMASDARLDLPILEMKMQVGTGRSATLVKAIGDEIWDQVLGGY